ncbi:hypothetical protein K376_03221 [Streptomyces sp. PsTaAH-130]|nr:hypothetical protein K376_03221 [Streptomyces sp. PsTaAH-130]
MVSDPTEAQVGPGVEGDLDVLTEIYDHSVRETAITFGTAPLTPPHPACAPAPAALPASPTRKTARTA